MRRVGAVPFRGPATPLRLPCRSSGKTSATFTPISCSVCRMDGILRSAILRAHDRAGGHGGHPPEPPHQLPATLRWEIQAGGSRWQQLPALWGRSQAPPWSLSTPIRRDVALGVQG